MTSANLVTTVYRHLLRSASQAVRHDRAASSNLRRLLRDDLESAVKAGIGKEQLIQHSGITMLLHLASARSKEDSSPTNRLAHRTIRNIASLCYHHLSPITHMQPFTKKRRAGGTDTASLRRRRGSSGLKRGQNGAALAMKSFESGLEPSAASTAPAMDMQVLPSLVVRPKPIRGPIYTSYYRSFLPGRWDGQKTVKTIQVSSAFVAHIESMLEATSEDLENAKERYGMYSAPVLSLRAKLKQLKGEVKSAYKQRQKIDDRRSIQSEAANLLQRTVSKAQANNGPWLGTSRFSRWASGAWLPP